MINYYLLSKPGIILGNLITVAAGFLLASKGTVDFWLFFATMAGLAFIIGSGCAFNNYINRDMDKKMKRTENRAIVTGAISGPRALLFATCLVLIGNLILLFSTNLLTVFLADSGFFIYVFLYSFWKCRTIYGTAIGSLSGAVPPVVGYCAVSNHFDLGALILFAALVCWQMPHFFAIAIYHFDDYAAANIPALPIKRGMLRTKIHMLFYIVTFLLTTFLLTFFNYTGYMYLIATLSVGLVWLALCIKGFKSDNNTLWGQQMFRLSLVMIFAFCLAIPMDIQVYTKGKKLNWYFD